jgi:hypothetical protein
VKYNFISKYIFISGGNLFVKHWGNTMNDNKGVRSYIILKFGHNFVIAPGGNGKKR